jgi:hypothetical protein
MRRVVLLATWFGVMTGSAACAYQFDEVRLEWGTGSGGNMVLLVVDFWPGNGSEDSFAFIIQFSDPQITGLQVLDALQAADEGFSYAADGGFLTDIWYVKDGVSFHTTYDWPVSYWSYWASPDLGQTWNYALTGPADRILQNGDTDGWLAIPGDDYTSVPITPLIGDMNCDGAVNAFDIDPFVLAIVNPAGYAQQFTHCYIAGADVNRDGQINAFDIDPFVGLLTG